ncbi:hypothetical protein [Klebsiella michiganensis]|nr:hypothetical protein [Klebsiella michiganensis]
MMDWRGFFPVALRLAGLRGYSRLRTGSPGKARSAATRGMCRD